ncbi:glycosyltransferase [Blastochloris viridis]|uniref:Glycosyl transferase n=1 Tax=Blastochloris viridis TaxID=1079 RepID=A0A182D2B3_BLAVI|nr:glycosyltransferase [Blastochloris viridis]ALK10438.1 Glycosyl transferase family 2 [Blastochloris viridis]BAR99620.1 glycosyl transferase [Blastochloris viridis]
MISVIIPTHNNERTLVPCFAALVPAVSTGVLRDVVVADGGSHDDTVAVSDAAGCTIIADPAARDLGVRLRRAAAEARADWLLFLRPDIVLEDGWGAAVEAFAAAAGRRGSVAAAAAAFRYAVDADGALPRLAEWQASVARVVRGRVRPEQGLLVHRRLYDAVGRHPDGAMADHRLLSRLGRKVGLLRSRAFVQHGG